MRIALVVPDASRMAGNRLAFSIAAALAHEHAVTVLSQQVAEGLLEAIRALVAPARFEFLRTVRPRPISGTRYVLRQLARGPDRALERRLRTLHDAEPFDAVVVFSNEGRWLGEYLARWPAERRPIRALCFLELIDHSFLMAYGRSHPVVRTALYPVYGVLHALERRRLGQFDVLIAISGWSARLLEYLYGIPAPVPSVAAIDLGRFRPAGPAVVPGPSPYLAVPTAGIDPAGRALVARLSAQGVPIVSFGPEPVPGVPYRGFVDDDALVRILAGAAATLFLFEYEALGLLPLESLAVGTPVITYPKQGPYSELGSNPFVHFGADPGTLEHWCHRLLATPKSPESVAACRQSVAAFTPEAAARRLLMALESSARGEPAGRAPPVP